MDKEIEKTVVDIENLKKIKLSLEEEIDKLQKIQGNIQAQAKNKQVKEEADERIEHAQKLSMYVEKERILENKRVAVESKEDEIEVKENRLKSRISECEKREQRTLDLEEKIKDLNNQRANFEEYKRGILKELELAQIKIVETDALFEKIDAEKSSIRGREIKVLALEKEWNDRIGALEQDERRFRIEKENFLGLQSIQKEVVNV